MKLANNEIIESPRKVTRRIQEERAKSEIGYVLQGSIPKAHVNNSSRDGFCRNMTPPRNREVVRGSEVGGVG